jgi:isocitrate dehydrogenase (NAD+)
MLDHLGETRAAKAVREGVQEVLSEGRIVTADIRKNLTGSTEGAAKCSEYAQAVADAVSSIYN